MAAYHCKACGIDFDHLTNAIFARHHQPLRKWILCLCLIGLNFQSIPATDLEGVLHTGLEAIAEYLRARGELDLREWI